MTAGLVTPRAADDLRVPEEPTRLRAATRTMAEQDPAVAAARLADGEWLAARLWRRWGPQLRAHGMRRREFVAIVRGYRQELWLWVMGERTWAHCAAGLAGRASRRVRSR